jgi:two-component system chemotaxis response regulator CheY
MTIMNVDDSMTMRKIVTLALKGQGHTVVEAENGKLALEALASQKVDAIILDINMPVMNGIEFLREIKKDPSKKGIPIVVLTTQGEDALKDEALSLGAKSFMIKPFQKDELLATLKKIVG